MYVTQGCKAAGHGPRYMGLRRVTVDVYLEVADVLSWFDVVGADTQRAFGMRCCWREIAH